MAIETELKLSLSLESLHLLKTHPWLRSLSIKRAVTHKLYSIYFDTSDLQLRNKRMALRLRRVGKLWVQTLKGRGSVQAGLHSRSEWETPVASEALDFEAIKAIGGQLPHGVHKNLSPVFVTNFSRSLRLVSFEGAEIEISLDSGEIRANDKTHPISELELELKSGEPQQLFRFALVLLDIVPLQIEQTNKAQFGYRLWQESTGLEADANFQVAKAQYVQLTKSMNVKDTLQALIWTCLQHLQANVPGAIRKLDKEYLHQVRVALRRLRVVLAMTAKMHDDVELNSLREEVAELTVVLGRLREWDVFVTQTLVPISTRLSQHAGLTELIKASETMRVQHHVSVERKLNSSDFQRLLLHFGLWMFGGYWQQIFESPLSLSDFARRMLDKRSLQITKLGPLINSRDDRQLHQFRIACKKLRYSVEMFGTLFGQAKHYLAALADLQEITGTLNDISVALGLLQQLENSERQETIFLMRGWLEHDYADSFIQLKKVWLHFTGQSPFWL